jgi:benzodiazapine receptor
VERAIDHHLSDKRMKVKKTMQLITCILIPIAIGAISGFITRNEMGKGGWFDSLLKPSFNPPNVVFGPVWITLYTLMGISLYMVWTINNNNRKKALLIFCLQLFFNFWWSILFFYFHLLFASVIDILALWICIVWMIVVFKRIKPIAAYLQLPYLAWVSFASVLDISIWMLNRQLL